MEYPIIDYLVPAYTKNNWTGLDIIESLNLFHAYDKTETKNGITLTINNGVFTFNGSSNIQTDFDIDIDEFTIPIAISKSGNGCMYFFNDFNTTSISLIYYYNDTRIDSWSFSPDNKVSSSYSGQGGKTINKAVLRFNANSINTGSFSPMFTDNGRTDNTFTPGFSTTSDIEHRLKLPLIKCYPLLDALKSAATGTITNDEKEILIHYLEPLGIGGI